MENNGYAKRAIDEGLLCRGDREFLSYGP